MSPDGHTRFYITVEPLSEEEIISMQYRSHREIANILKIEPSRLWVSKRNGTNEINLLIDATTYATGCKEISTIKKYINMGFLYSLNGVFINAPIRGIKVLIHHIILYYRLGTLTSTNSMGRMMINAVHGAIRLSTPKILQPLYEVTFEVIERVLREIYEFINLCKGYVYQETTVANGRIKVYSIIPIHAHLLNFIQLCEIIIDSGGYFDFQFNSWIPVNGDLNDKTSEVYKLMVSLRIILKLDPELDENRVTIITPPYKFI